MWCDFTSLPFSLFNWPKKTHNLHDHVSRDRSGCTTTKNHYVENSPSSTGGCCRLCGLTCTSWSSQWERLRDLTLLTLEMLRWIPEQARQMNTPREQEPHEGSAENKWGEMVERREVAWRVWGHRETCQRATQTYLLEIFTVNLFSLFLFEPDEKCFPLLQPHLF